MTPEQLDEIEKRWAGYLEKDEVERRFLFDQWWDKRDFWDMTKALREAWEERDEALGDARLADCQLDEIVELVGSGGDGSAFGSVESLLCDLKERTEERDEARAEAAEIRKKRNADLLALEKSMDASAEGSWMARALDAERERDEARAEVERLTQKLKELA